MGKEKFVRSKPHVNAPEETDGDLASPTPPSAGAPVPTDTVSFNYSKIEWESRPQETIEPGELKAPPLPSDEPPPIGGTGTITYTGLESPADTHEIEKVSLTYQRIELEHAPDDGPSTMVQLEPQPDDTADSLTTDSEAEGILIGQLVPAIQKINDADTDPDDLELDL